jgi:hypothetical protein
MSIWSSLSKHRHPFVQCPRVSFQAKPSQSFLQSNHTAVKVPSLSRASTRLQSQHLPLPRRSHTAISLPSSLHVIAVNTRRRSVVVKALASLLLLVVIDVFYIESMDMAREVTEQREADVDEEVGAAAGDDVDSDGRDWWICVSLAARGACGLVDWRCERETYGIW